MTTLIAEDLLLLLLDDVKGSVPSTNLETVLGGALLLELALAEAVSVEPKPGLWRSAKVRAAAGATMEDPVLGDALATVRERERSAQELVKRLGKGRKDELADRLVTRGILERQEDKVLGLFPRTRWPAVDSTHEEDVRRRLTAALVHGQEPDPRTGALIALLRAVDRAHKVVPLDGASAREVRKRGKEIAEGAWAAKAVKDVIEASTAAVIAATTAATAGGATAGS